jgi:hypothetical protein
MTASLNLFRLSALAASCLTLISCGGNDSPNTAQSAASGATVTYDAKFYEAAARKASSWVWITSEGNMVALPDTSARHLRYGHPDAGWHYRTTYNDNVGIGCTTEWFRADPAPGLAKFCEVLNDGEPVSVAPVTTTTEAAPAVTSASVVELSNTWRWMTEEGRSFSFPGQTKVIRYGRGGEASTWATKVVTDGGYCSVDFMGSDPSPGFRKYCEVNDDPSASSEAFTAVLVPTAALDLAAAPAPAPEQAPAAAAPAPEQAPTPAPSAPAPAPEQAPPPPPPPPPAAPEPTPSPAPAPTGGTVNAFFSGHSLFDNPLANNVEAIAASLGRQTSWNQQIVLGSPIRYRTRGNDSNDNGFPGYRFGKNRDGEGMDVVNELRNPQTINGQRYQALILTERHDLVPTLQYEDTVINARHMHERLIEGNAQGTTYLSHSWLDIYDKNNPGAFVAYERAAAKVWQCTAARVNVSLANEGRRDRMQYMPSGLALAYLVERSTQGFVDGITRGSSVETVNMFFRDAVHMNDLGAYYMALVTYASIHRQSPAGAWAPAGVSATQARSLQDIAWTAVSSYYNNPETPSMASCSQFMRDDFCARNANHRGVPGSADSCIGFFSASRNPFDFNAATDRNIWAPAPTR